MKVQLLRSSTGFAQFISAQIAPRASHRWLMEIASNLYVGANVFAEEDWYYFYIRDYLTVHVYGPINDDF